MSSTVPLLPQPADEASYIAQRGDPALWIPALQVICKRHDLPSSDLYAERTGTHIVFRVSEGPWIKLFAPLWPEDFLRERAGLAAVSRVEALVTPELLAEGELEGWPYVILSHLPGRPLATIWRDLEAAQQADIARQLGTVLRRLHAVDVSTCEAITPAWPAFVAEQIGACGERNRQAGTPAAWLQQLEPWLKEQTGLAARSKAPVLLHADVTDEHVFVTREQGRWRVTGLIDFGDAMVGDRLYEFAAPATFLTSGRPAVQQALLAGYGFSSGALEHETLAGLRAWTLLHRFAQLPQALRFCQRPKPENLAGLLEALWMG